MLKIFLLILLAFIGIASPAATPLPKAASDLIKNYCLDCHDSETRKGDISLDDSSIDWSTSESKVLWERALKAVSKNQMPPKKKRDQPTEEERASLVQWLDKKLTEHSPRGGTIARRLNHEEYRNSIEFLLSMDFPLPHGFPTDNEKHGFDNLGKSLFLSPPLMDAYTKAAASIADKVFPPPRPPVDPATHDIPAKDMVISYSSGSIRDGAMRLVSSCDNIMRSGTWPSKVEIRASGVYRVTVTTSTFRKETDEPFLLQVLARDVASNNSLQAQTLRVIQEINVSNESPETFEFLAEIYTGQTIVFRYDNAPLVSDPDKKEQLLGTFKKKFKTDPNYLAAWLEIVKANDQSFRGGIGWERIKKLIASDSMDISNATMDSIETKNLLEKIKQNPVLYTETVAYEHFENGPALNIHSATIDGPHELIEGPAERQGKRFQINFLGARNQRTDRQWNQGILNDLLTIAFRRPVDPETVNSYNDMIQQHRRDGHTREEAFH
ncbi:DUF1587 domain-containing protein, partial [bacterium]|nr:DUF1587 domain-containing protein [bacterium]